MGEKKKIIPIILSEKTIELSIFSESSEDSIFECFDATENGEARIQIKEGHFYEYILNDKNYCLQTSEIISQSKVNLSSGRISPNIYVGTLSIDLLNLNTKEKCGEIKLEVQSVKTSYREDYRLMLEEITEKCIDLLMQHNSPVSQLYETDFNADANTIYQRFAFIKSIVDSVEFNDSIHKIITAPVTKWKSGETIKDIRSIRRFGNSSLRQIGNATNRIELPTNHPLKHTVDSIPSKLSVSNKTETVDTPENRFVKHALLHFQTFCGDIREKVQVDSRLSKEALLLEDKLEQYLNHSVFKEINLPTTLPLNSPVLQRKEGYRELLRVWLMFDLAAKLVWHGGEDIYSGNKRDVAVLYEYWLFFKLLAIVKDIFDIDPLSTSELIEPTNDGLGLKLKQGKFLPIQGIYMSGTRRLKVEFSYNKTFIGDSQYPQGGSWTRNLRPDYTLSIWPFGIEQEQAEIEELIVHLHFDAKYKVENLQLVFGNESDLEGEKIDQKKGTYKRADLLKMHTYRDAIRRTAGAYILYPGSESAKKQGFHELLPGLGAFAISPSKQTTGEEHLRTFLAEVVAHFMNRTSQREKMSFNTYETYKDDNINTVNEPLPESFGPNRNFFPDETFVLIGFCKDDAHQKWIQEHKLYNFRTGTDRGSLPLGYEQTNARYLLLHSKGTIKSGRLYKLKNKGPRIFSKADLLRKEYPNPKGDLYIVYDIDDTIEEEFENKKWDVSQLEGYTSSRGSGLPFSISLAALMKALVR